VILPVRGATTATSDVTVTWSIHKLALKGLIKLSTTFVYIVGTVFFFLGYIQITYSNFSYYFVWKRGGVWWWKI